MLLRCNTAPQASKWQKRTKPTLFPLSKYSRWNIRPLHRLTILHLSSVSWTALLNLVMCVCVCVCVWAQLPQLCPTLCNPMDHSVPGSSVHGILQARILEWVIMPSCKGSFWPGDGTHVSCVAGRFFTHWATWEAQPSYINDQSLPDPPHLSRTSVAKLQSLSTLL